MNEQLFNDLYNASEYYRISNLYEQIKTRFRIDKMDCINKYTSMKERKESPVVANVLCMLSSIPVLLMGFAAEGFGTGLFKLLGLAMLIGFPIWNTIRCKNLEKKYQKDAEDFWYSEGGYISAENDKNYNKAQRELEVFQNSNRHVVEFLPAKYRNLEATQYMAYAVGNRRADSLKEVINLYELQLHRWEMERLSQQAVYQNMQLQNSLDRLAEQQADTNRQLRNIEDLEFYSLIRSM